MYRLTQRRTDAPFPYFHGSGKAIVTFVMWHSFTRSVAGYDAFAQLFRVNNSSAPRIRLSTWAWSVGLVSLSPVPTWAAFGESKRS